MSADEDAERLVGAEAARADEGAVKPAAAPAAPA